jgi:hypothetical protein
MAEMGEFVTRMPGQIGVRCDSSHNLQGGVYPQEKKTKARIGTNESKRLCYEKHLLQNSTYRENVCMFSRKVSVPSTGHTTNIPTIEQKKPT